MYFKNWYKKLKIEKENFKIIDRNFIFIKRKYNEIIFQKDKQLDSNRKRSTILNSNIKLDNEIKSKRIKIRKSLIINNAYDNKAINKSKINDFSPNINDSSNLKYFSNNDSDEKILTSSFTIFSKYKRSFVVYIQSWVRMYLKKKSFLKIRNKEKDFLKKPLFSNCVYKKADFKISKLNTRNNFMKLLMKIQCYWRFKKAKKFYENLINNEELKNKKYKIDINYKNPAKVIKKIVPKSKILKIIKLQSRIRKYLAKLKIYMYKKEFYTRLKLKLKEFMKERKPAIIRKKIIQKSEILIVIKLQRRIKHYISKLKGIHKKDGFYNVLKQNLFKPQYDRKPAIVRKIIVTYKKILKIILLQCNFRQHFAKLKLLKNKNDFHKILKQNSDNFQIYKKPAIVRKIHFQCKNTVKIIKLQNKIRLYLEKFKCIQNKKNYNSLLNENYFKLIYNKCPAIIRKNIISSKNIINIIKIQNKIRFYFGKLKDIQNKNFFNKIIKSYSDKFYTNRKPALIMKKVIYHKEILKVIKLQIKIRIFLGKLKDIKNKTPFENNIFHLSNKIHKQRVPALFKKKTIKNTELQKVIKLQCWIRLYFCKLKLVKIKNDFFNIVKHKSEFFYKNRKPVIIRKKIIPREEVIKVIKMQCMIRFYLAKLKLIRNKIDLKKIVKNKSEIFQNHFKPLLVRKTVFVSKDFIKINNLQCKFRLYFAKLKLIKNKKDLYEIVNAYYDKSLKERKSAIVRKINFNSKTFLKVINLQCLIRRYLGKLKLLKIKNDFYKIVKRQPHIFRDFRGSLIVRKKIIPNKKIINIIQLQRIIRLYFANINPIRNKNDFLKMVKNRNYIINFNRKPAIVSKLNFPSSELLKIKKLQNNLRIHLARLKFMQKKNQFYKVIKLYSEDLKNKRKPAIFKKTNFSNKGMLNVINLQKAIRLYLARFKLVQKKNEFYKDIKSFSEKFKSQINSVIIRKIKFPGSELLKVKKLQNNLRIHTARIKFIQKKNEFYKLIKSFSDNFKNKRNPLIIRKLKFPNKDILRVIKLQCRIRIYLAIFKLIKKKNEFYKLIKPNCEKFKNKRKSAIFRKTNYHKKDILKVIKLQNKIRVYLAMFKLIHKKNEFYKNVVKYFSNRLLYDRKPANISKISFSFKEILKIIKLQSKIRLYLAKLKLIQKKKESYNILKHYSDKVYNNEHNKLEFRDLFYKENNKHFNLRYNKILQPIKKKSYSNKIFGKIIKLQASIRGFLLRPLFQKVKAGEYILNNYKYNYLNYTFLKFCNDNIKNCKKYNDNYEENEAFKEKIFNQQNLKIYNITLQYERLDKNFENISTKNFENQTNKENENKIIDKRSVEENIIREIVILSKNYYFKFS